MSGIIWQSFSINLKILKAFGLYPSEKLTRLSRVQSYLLYVVFTYPVPLLGIINFMFRTVEDEMRMGENGFLVAETACQITKLMPFITNGSRIKRCIHYLEHSLFEVEEYNKIFLKDCTSICRRNSKLFLGAIIAGNVSLTVKRFLEKEIHPVVDVWLPYSLMDNFVVYCVIFVVLSLGVAYVSIASAAIDPLIGGLCCLTSGHLQVLKNNLQYFNERSATNNSSLRRNIKKCIRHHNKILTFVKEYESCFSIIVFSQFAGSVFVLCFCCLQLSRMSPTTINFFITVGYFSILLAQIYFYCYYGTILYEESNSLTTAVYMGNWYEYDIYSRRDLILLMERSKRPIIVTTGKILDLSVITFTTILRRSYSLLAVLKNQ